MDLSDSMVFWGTSCPGTPICSLTFSWNCKCINEEKQEILWTAAFILLRRERSRGAWDSLSHLLICWCSVAPWINDGILLNAKVTVNLVTRINHNFQKWSGMPMLSRWLCNQKHGVWQAGMVCFWGEVSYRLHIVSSMPVTEDWIDSFALLLHVSQGL